MRGRVADQRAGRRSDARIVHRAAYSRTRVGGEALLRLEPEPAKQVGQRRAPILRRGAHVRHRREVGVQCALRGHDGRFVPASLLERLLAATCPARNLRHAAAADANAFDACPVAAQVKAGEHRRDVLVESLRDLVGAYVRAGLRAWHADRLDELAGGERGLAIAGVEVLERHGALRIAPAKHDARAQRDQDRHRIADRRSVGDVAAKRPGVADRNRGEARPDFGEHRVLGVERRERIRQRGRGADAQRFAVVRDGAQLRDLAGVDERSQLAVLLGDPEPDVGRAGEKLRIRLRRAQRRELGQRRRRVVTLAAVRVLQGRACARARAASGQARALHR